MANTIALNQDAKVKFKVGYESTLLDKNSSIYSKRDPGTIYFAIKEDKIDPSKKLIGSIYYDVDSTTRIKMSGEGYAITDSLNQDIISTYVKSVSLKDDKVTVLVKKGNNNSSEFRLNFVDRAGDTITGNLTIGGLTTLNGGAYFNTSSGSKPLIIGRTETKGREQTSLYHTDTDLVFDLINDEEVANILFNMRATDTENGGGAKANDGSVTFRLVNGKTTVVANHFSGLALSATSDEIGQNIAKTYLKNITQAGTINSRTLTVTKGDNSQFSLDLPLATASLAGLVSGEAQTFGGQKTFNETIYTKKGIQFGSASGTSGSSGWVNFLEITVSQSYKNTPIEIVLFSRGREVGYLTLGLRNENSSTPAVSIFNYYGGNYDARVVQSGSTYKLYYLKSEAYDSLGYIINASWSQLGSGVAFKSVDVHSTADPGGTKATFKLEASTSNKANQDSSGQNINATYIKKLNYYLANGDTKPSDYRSATHNMITSTLGNNGAGSWVKLIGADGSYAGLLTAAAQTIGGTKTFNEKATFSKGLDSSGNVSIKTHLKVEGNTTLNTLQTTGNVNVGVAGSGAGGLNVAGGTVLEGTLVGTTATFKSSSSVTNSINSNGFTTNAWFVSTGNTGWRNSTHGGGWYMSDSSWIRTYGGKNVYHNTGIFRTDGTLQVGENGARFHVNTSNIFLNLDTILPADKSIIQYQGATSNWASGLQWWTGGVKPTKTYAAGIARHNTGGNSSNPGVITIVPHDTDTTPWSRSVGLSIGYSDLQFEGRRVVTSTLNTAVGGTNQPIYISASGQATAITGNWGGNSRLMYVSGGKFTTSTANVGTSKRPVYLLNGTVTQCDLNIDNNAATASKVYVKVNKGAKYYLAGSQLTTDGNADIYQDTKVYIAAEPGHLVAQRGTFGTQDYTLANAKGASLYSHGNAHIGGNLNVQGNITYESGPSGTTKTSMIRFIPNTSDAYGHGISIGGGGAAIFGSGESASNIVSWLSIAGGTETTYVTSDSGIQLYTNLNNNLDSSNCFMFDGASFRPKTNNTNSIGTSSVKWNYAYFTNSTIDYGYFVSGLKVGNYTGIDTDRTNFKLATQGLIVNDWVRTRGATGWYNQTYEGGWYMTNARWIRNYNKGVYISGGASFTTLSSTNNQGSQLVVASTTSDTGAGGTASIELFRGANASWKIANEGGILHFLNNYTDAKQASYTQTALKMNYNTGASSIPYLAIGTTDFRTDYRLFVNGTSYLSGNSIINGTLRTYNNITVQKSSSTDTTENSVKVANANGVIELIASGHRGVYDRTSSRYLIGTTTANGAYTPSRFAVGTTSSSTTNAYTFYVNGTSHITSNLSVGGTTTLTGKLTINNAVDVNGAFKVGSGHATTLGGTLSVSGATTLSRTLNVTGVATLGSNLIVNGTSTLKGAVTAQSTLAVTGATTLSSTLTVNGATTLNGALNAKGVSTFSNTVYVNGLSTFTKKVTVNADMAINGNVVMGTDKTLTMNGRINLRIGDKQGLKLGASYITAANASSGEVVFQGGHLRFGSLDWDYNHWAGLKYVHGTKTISLGLADGTVFNANSAQSGGIINTPGIEYFEVKNIRNLAVGGGIYWNPYVESSTDNTDAASIRVIAGGAGGGTELRIQQANDSNDVINLMAPYYIYMNSKRAFGIYDGWLRINENSAFSSGIYAGTSLIRSDNQLQVGSGGANFYANAAGNGYFSTSLGISGKNTAYKLYVNGLSNFRSTVVIDSTTGSYGEGLRINAADAAWATITLGSTGNTGTRANCWSIHRKNDNNFAISKNSSDGLNGLVMTSTGMGLGIAAPTYRLHVVGDILAQNSWLRTTGNTGWHSDTYGGGIYMKDSSWIRTYGGKSFYCDAVIQAGNRFWTGYDSGQANSMSASNWFRSSGATGWLNATYGGGIYMTDSTWIRTYGSKNFYCNAAIQGSRIYAGYDAGIANSISCSDWFRSSGSTGWYNQTYGGGWYMTDSSYVRSYNNKPVVASSFHGNLVGSSDSANVLNSNPKMSYGWNGLNYFNASMSASSGAAGVNDSPTSDWYHVIRMNHANGAGYYFDIAACFHNDNMYYKRVSSGSTGGWKRIWIQGNSVTGAVWNDYAECRQADTTEAGYVLSETGSDDLVKTTERLQHFAGISSDTWGFSQGETDKAKTHIAVAGRVLAYPYQDRNNYKPGDCVCAAPGGTVDIMTREEIIQYPDRIVGTVSCVPDYDSWGGGEGSDREPVKINGRVWIKVR